LEGENRQDSAGTLVQQRKVLNQHGIESNNDVPGLVLTAGTYWFTLANRNSDRNIVQVMDADRMQLVTTILAIPDYRLQPTEKTVIHFEERPSESPEAIPSWYYPGTNYGEEFVYPKTEALQFAKQTSRPVLSMPDEPPADTTQIKQTSVKAINRSGEGIEITEVVATQACGGSSGSALRVLCSQLAALCLLWRQPGCWHWRRPSCFGWLHRKLCSAPRVSKARRCLDGVWQFLRYDCPMLGASPEEGPWDDSANRESPSVDLLFVAGLSALTVEARHHQAWAHEQLQKTSSELEALATRSNPTEFSTHAPLRRNRGIALVGRVDVACIHLSAMIAPLRQFQILQLAMCRGQRCRARLAYGAGCSPRYIFSPPG
jgi:hypothetical protein